MLFFYVGTTQTASMEEALVNTGIRGLAWVAMETTAVRGIITAATTAAVITVVTSGTAALSTVEEGVATGATGQGARTAGEMTGR